MRAVSFIWRRGHMAYEFLFTLVTLIAINSLIAVPAAGIISGFINGSN